jgi:elongation factor P
MADTSDFRNGLIMKIDGNYWQIQEFQHVKPGKGGAFVRTKIKNVVSGAVKEQTFRSGEKIEEVRVVRHSYQYLYESGGIYYLMDKSTYEQLELSGPMMSDQSGYLKENLDIDVLMDGEKPLVVEIPNFVELAVSETEPGFKGDTAQGGTKPAKMETGLTVTVPLFISEGDVLKIDTRTGKYVERV